MPYIDMSRELLGDVPGTPLSYAQTCINQALQLIYDEQRWSFQAGESGWLTPGLLPGNGTASPGTITVVPFQSTIVGDAIASAAWNALVGRPFITERQIRVAPYAVYSIIAIDPGTDPASANYPFATLTLDRPWMEAAFTATTYMLYQCYFPAPAGGFRKFTSMRDTTNNVPIDYQTKTQQWLAEFDAQRENFDQPTDAVPYKVDQRPNSATLGQMLYELWPHPLSVKPYYFSFLISGSLLALPGDTVPYPLNEELVVWRAKEILCLWKEAQKGDGMERGSGADWRFLSQAAHEQYKLRLKTVQLLDVGLGDLYWNKFHRTRNFNDGYETSSGTLNVGW